MRLNSNDRADEQIKYKKMFNWMDVHGDASACVPVNTPIHLINANTFSFSSGNVCAANISLPFHLDWTFFSFRSFSIIPLLFHSVWKGFPLRVRRCALCVRVRCAPRPCHPKYFSWCDWNTRKYIIYKERVYRSSNVLFINGRIALVRVVCLFVCWFGRSFDFKCFSWAFEGARVCRIHATSHQHEYLSSRMRESMAIIISVCVEQSMPFHFTHSRVCHLAICVCVFCIIWFIVRNENVNKQNQ